VEVYRAEWLSLPPRSHHLSIAGNHVSLHTKEGLGINVPTVPLRSNTIEFEVLKAELEWKSEQLALWFEANTQLRPSGA
jgi:hypothetical protein